MQWTDDTCIETPEQIDVSLELAGLGSRFVARIMDWLIKGLGGILILAVLGVFVALLTGAGAGRYSALLVAALISAGFLLAVAYDVYFEVRHNGQTPGKRQAGIRVIRDGGAPVDFRSSCVRNLLSIADLLPAFYLLGGFFVLVTRRHQRLGDMAAGTLVIRERAEKLPDDVGEAVDQLASPEHAFTGTQLATCAGDDRHILRSFFQRYHELDALHRHQLACRLAEQYVQRTGYAGAAPLDNGAQAEQFLASLYRDLESAARQGR